MKTTILLVLATLTLASCSSGQVKERTKWTDKGMRVMIDPDSIGEENYVQIQNALVNSGKFTVVDRAQGLKAMKKEQETTQRVETDRFADKEKWSHWGKMFGVGSIIVAHTQCRREHSMFNRNKMLLNCDQFLSMVDSNTGEVFVSVKGNSEGEASFDLGYMYPSWDKTVDTMVEAYPKNYRPENYSKEVITYQDISAEHAQRQKELTDKKE